MLRNTSTLGLRSTKCVAFSLRRRCALRKGSSPPRQPLMEWLEHYTFKSEARIDADPNGLGARVYKKLVGRMIEAGTTLASVFGTLTVDAK